MDLFLIHCLILAWGSIGISRYWNKGPLDILLAAAVLAWANLIITSLILAAVGRLGDPLFFFWVSTLLTALPFLIAKIRPPTDFCIGPPQHSSSRQYNPWLLSCFFLSLLFLCAAVITIAFTYAPNNPGALTHYLPRALYYLGQNSLAHFDAADYRQIYPPINGPVLNIFGLVYHPPLQCLNIFNFFAWSVSGIAIFRVCRLLACSPHASLIASWAMLTAIPVIARTISVSPDLLVVAGILSALVFILKWKQSQRPHDALLFCLALGATAGASLIATALVLALGALWSVKFYKKKPPASPNIRAWILPVIVALILAAPYLIINLYGLAQSNPTPILPSDAGLIGPEIGNILRSFKVSSPLFILNEHTAGIGLTGIFLIFSGIWYGYQNRRRDISFNGLIWLSLGWFSTGSILHLWMPQNLGKLLPAFLLLTPCAAALIDKASHFSGARRYATNVILFILIGSNLWADCNYLLRNTDRPLLPLLKAGFVPPALPTLPLLAVHRLSVQTHLNINTDGVDESISPFLVQGNQQCITSKRETDLSAYNLISRATTSRNRAYDNSVKQSSYILFPIPNKRTSGVEFLCSFGTGSVTRDYFGILPQAGQTAAIDGNKTVLITLERIPEQDTNFDIIRLELNGLNTEDHNRLLVYAKHDANSDKLLAKFTHDKITEISIPTPFQHLLFKIIDITNEQEIGSSTLPYLPQSTDELKPLDPKQPSNNQSLFVHDLVTSQDTGGIIAEGLLPTEGPFPQWNIPFIRWAKQEEIKIIIPESPELKLLQLSFSVRLHVRPKGGLEVLLNGQIVQHYRLEGQTIWLDDTLTLTPQPGVNIIQFRDAVLKDEPDWIGYLDRYPDVKDYLLSEKIPLEAGARQHYKDRGKAEGRILERNDIKPKTTDSHYFMFRNIRLEGFES